MSIIVLWRIIIHGQGKVLLGSARFGLHSWRMRRHVRPPPHPSKPLRRTILPAALGKSRPMTGRSSQSRTGCRRISRPTPVLWHLVHERSAASSTVRCWKPWSLDSSPRASWSTAHVGRCIAALSHCCGARHSESKRQSERARWSSPEHQHHVGSSAAASCHQSKGSHSQPSWSACISFRTDSHADPGKLAARRIGVAVCSWSLSSLVHTIDPIPAPRVPRRSRFHLGIVGPHSGPFPAFRHPKTRPGRGTCSESCKVRQQRTSGAGQLACWPAGAAAGCRLLLEWWVVCWSRHPAASPWATSRPAPKRTRHSDSQHLGSTLQWHQHARSKTQYPTHPILEVRTPIVSLSGQKMQTPEAFKCDLWQRLPRVSNYLMKLHTVQQ